MKIKNLLLLIAFTSSCFIAFAQPSESQLNKKVQAYVKDPSRIISIEYSPSKIEKRWYNNHWTTFWSRACVVKMGTGHSGIYKKLYGGVEYFKEGSSYTYFGMLTFGLIGFEGITNPNVEEINAHLTATYDPLDFYQSYQMNYLIDAPNTVKLAKNPDWRWKGLNKVVCNVVSTYTTLVNDIGDVEVREGTFPIILYRSADGVTYNEEDDLLKSGKWLPAEKAREESKVVIKSYRLSKIELAEVKTLAQLNAVRHAEEFKKSLAVVELPEFKSANHLMQFTHELLIEGDKDKVTAFFYKMSTDYMFEEWSDIVLNRNGKEALEKLLENLEYYKVAFCKHPIIRDIGSSYVRFYDRNKKRLNNITVSYKNDRWYVTDMKYGIYQEDFADYEKNQDDKCGENPIYLDAEPQFKVGDMIEITYGSSWMDAEVLSVEMEKGGYNVKYGVSGLTDWRYVSEVRAKAAPETPAVAFKDLRVDDEVKALHEGKWYDGKVMKVSYEAEEYLVDIPEINERLWLKSAEVEYPSKKKNADKVENVNSESTTKEEGKVSKNGKKLLGGLKNKVKSAIP